MAHPRKLIEVIAVGAIAAATQGMDESTISGATLFYPKAFGVRNEKRRFNRRVGQLSTILVLLGHCMLDIRLLE